VALAWIASSDNVGVTAYDVYAGSTLVASSATNGATVQNLVPATPYTFSVRARDAAGNASASSGALSVITAAAVDTQAPSAPSSLSAASIGSTSVVLTWIASTDNVGVAAYDLYSGSTMVGSSASNSATVQNLLPATSYTFSVRARDGAGNSSAASGALTLITASSKDVTPPSVPSNLVWANDGGTVTLSWNASTDDGGAPVVYDLLFGSFYLGSFDGTSVALIGFTVGTPYAFTVKARDAAGNVSAASNQVTVLLSMGQDTTPPSAPTNLTTTNVTASSVSLRWSASKDDVGVVLYQVYAGGAVAATAIGSTSAVVAGLSANTTYVFTVKAVDAASNTSAASASLSVTTSQSVTPAAISVSASSLAFGTVLASSSRSQTFAISNTGGSVLNVAMAPASGTSGIYSVSPASFSLVAGGRKVGVVTYAPTAAGSSSGTLLVTSNDSSRPSVNVSLSGTCAANAYPGCVASSPGHTSNVNCTSCHSTNPCSGSTGGGGGGGGSYPGCTAPTSGHPSGSNCTQCHGTNPCGG
jgi:chitodextrinase